MARATVNSSSCGSNLYNRTIYGSHRDSIKQRGGETDVKQRGGETDVKQSGGETDVKQSGGETDIKPVSLTHLTMPTNREV